MYTRPIVGIASTTCELGQWSLNLVNTVLSDDLEAIPFMLWVLTDVNDLGRATKNTSEYKQTM